MRVRDLRPSDWPEVARIYEQGIRTGHATFETSVPSWAEWDAAHLEEHRLVAVLDGRLAGWVALVRGYRDPDVVALVDEPAGIVADDVVVGQDMAFGADDRAGAGATARAQNRCRARFAANDAQMPCGP